MTSKLTLVLPVPFQARALGRVPLVDQGQGLLAELQARLVVHLVVHLVAYLRLIHLAHLLQGYRGKRQKDVSYCWELLEIIFS